MSGIFNLMRKSLDSKEIIFWFYINGENSKVD
jgi:hypothetical protein